MYYVLGVGYARSRAGSRAGASGTGGSEERAVPVDIRAWREAYLGVHMKSWHPDPTVRQKAFWGAHHPIWEWLLKNADVTLVVDPEQQNIIWGWMVTSGDEVLHAIGCKRSFCERVAGEPPLSVDLVGALLGDRLHRHQVCSLELPQMRVKGKDTTGLDRPREWSMDPTWLLTRMVSR